MDRLLQSGGVHRRPDPDAHPQLQLLTGDPGMRVIDTDAIVIVFTTAVVLYTFWLTCRVISFIYLSQTRDEYLYRKHPILTMLFFFMVS